MENNRRSSSSENPDRREILQIGPIDDFDELNEGGKDKSVELHLLDSKEEEKKQKVDDN